MTPWLALRRLLTLLAVIGLALTPVAASAAAVGMHAAAAPSAHSHMSAGYHAELAMDMSKGGMPDRDMPTDDGGGMAMDDMPCCPPAHPAKPDCGKGCPLMALCLATAASLVPAAVAMPVPGATRASPAWPDTTSPASLKGAPAPEPPRT